MSKELSSNNKDEFKSIKIIRFINKISFFLILFSTFMIMLLTSNVEFKYVVRRFILVAIFIVINYFIFNFIIDWSENTVHIKIHTKELLECNKEIKELLIKQQQ